MSSRMKNMEGKQGEASGIKGKTWLLDDIKVK
jgi:hypothetical protein